MNKHREGFTLVELLVVIALIGVLISFALPTGASIMRNQAKNSAVSLVMGGLEQARLSACAGKKEVWVVFRNDPAKRSSLRLVTQEPECCNPLGNWITLPQGIIFQPGANTLMGQQPPAPVTTAAVGSQESAQATLGGILYQRSGRIGMPQPGGPPLTLQLASGTAPEPEPISISRATGRPSIR
jgi:prepilin-type N-terminal cleavage/methylation domain-containing protein